MTPEMRAKLDAMQSQLDDLQANKNTGAKRIAAMRERDKAAGINRQKKYDDARIKRSRDQSGRPYDPSRSAFVSAAFIGIDGEGVSEGRVTKYRQKLGHENTEYEGQAHYMMLLAASTGAEITAARGRLLTHECLDFLLQVQADNPKGILVCYGGSYDVNQMLLHGLPRETLRHISKGHKTRVVINGHLYKIEYRARKMLRVWRWAGEFVNTWVDYKGEYREEKPEAQFVLWDTLGFFQSSFVTTMQKWLGNDHPDLAMITRMKSERGQFDRADLDAMRVYNYAECRALAAIMDKLRDAVQSLGLTLNRWDGAGAIAAAMNSKHEIAHAKAECPEPVFEAARCAFSGGHIEVCRFGTFNKIIHHYDINSAYPSIIRDLPNLQGGRWTTGTDFDPPPGFTLVRVRFEFTENLPFYPLFFRGERGTIQYPDQGEGWYWYPEFEVARDFYTQFGGLQFEVKEWWHYTPKEGAPKPFAFVQEYYDARKEMVRKDKQNELTELDQWMKGGEKIIKLGLNSSYGKMAQQLGGSGNSPPPYFQLEWAGFVTSGCRAALMKAAMQAPNDIISFATDGLFSLAPLDLPTPKDKVLGAWEYQRHTGMVVAMPGVYWLFDEGETIGKDKPSGAYSRGFDKEYVSDPERILAAWREGKTSVELPMRRLITMGSACMGDDDRGMAWRARGRFLEGMRRLDISGASVKRWPPAGQRGKLRLWERDYATPVRANIDYLEWLQDGEPADDARGISAPYSIRWLDEEPEGGDPEIAYIAHQEMLDAAEDWA